MRKNPQVLTGIRPTATLTIANYLGAIKPFIELQKKYYSFLFVADIHALTDQDFKEVVKNRLEIVFDYLALGVDEKKSVLFFQSEIFENIAYLSFLLAKETNVAELLRVPTLKEKLKNPSKPQLANGLLFFYPVIMASDILIQRVKKVPVGEDQLPHLEIARELARSFNKRYKKIFPLPSALKIETLRILSLKGEGKMSKSNPNGAIFLTDSKEVVFEKIKTAETALEGEMSLKLKSHLLIIKELAKDKKKTKQAEELIRKHLKGEKVMRQFKEIFFEVVWSFIEEFQTKRKKIKKDEVEEILKRGKKIALENSLKTLELVKKAVLKL